MKRYRSPRFGDALKPCRDVDTFPENVIALDQDVSEIDADPEQHPTINGHSFVPLLHHRLHGYRALDRIDHRGKLKEHAVARRLDETPPVLCHESIGDLAVLAECVGGADLIEAHEPRVTRNVSRQNCR